MELGELGQVMAVARPVDHVGEQHDVVVGRELEPAAREHALRELDLVADLEHRRVGRAPAGAAASTASGGG